DDGPHVYWQTPTTAIVFHLCDRKLVQQRFEVTDTLRFRGFCTDSTQEYVIPAEPPKIQPHVYDGVSKMFAVSDIHGEFEPFVDLLQVAGIIDEQLHWSWGDGHFVLNGDIFDRGAFVTECLWLLYRLEQEARLAGGRVHVLFGNHEVMVLQRDLRYVNEKYTGGITRAARVNYTDLFGPDMELGRWLRTKHTAIRLNDVLFIHGGMPPRVAARGTSLDELNTLARETLDSRSYTIAFDERLRNYYLETDEGPFWYRGYHRSRDPLYPQATLAQVDSILERYDSRAIVVGHTGVMQVTSLYGGKVYGIDVPLESLGGFQGILFDGEKFFRVRTDGSRVPL
ncbi:MAG: metallophosphoesterase, partial [Gemmatimonadales bacterium]